MAGTSDRVKERNRVKRLIVKTKAELVKQANRLNKAPGVSLAHFHELQCTLFELEDFNRRLNALSAPIDEKTLLEQSLKRSTKEK